MRGCRRDFRSLTVDSTERLTGIDRPLNFTLTFIVFAGSLPSPVAPFVAIWTFELKPVASEDDKHPTSDLTTVLLNSS